MDFWVGNWTTRWKDARSRPRTGSNTVLDLDGRIRELFEGPSGRGRYVGVSVSAWNHGVSAWEQEYWDNTGYHAYFRGSGRPDGSFVLDQVRGGGLEAGPRRLVWHTITPDTFLWDYELSTDGGASWQSTWRIEYSRRT